MAATTIKDETKTALLDQMLEDLAGDEINEYDTYDFDADLDNFSDTDHFLEIDQYH